MVAASVPEKNVPTPRPPARGTVFAEPEFVTAAGVELRAPVSGDARRQIGNAVKLLRQRLERGVRADAVQINLNLARDCLAAAAVAQVDDERSIVNRKIETGGGAVQRRLAVVDCIRAGNVRIADQPAAGRVHAVDFVNQAARQLVERLHLPHQVLIAWIGRPVGPCS